MKLRHIVPGVVSVAATGLLLAAPALAYESPAPNVGVGGVSAASAGALPNTGADRSAGQPNAAVIAAAVGGGSLVVLGTLGFAYRRRR
jgi:hypothetical protein